MAQPTPSHPSIMTPQTTITATSPLPTPILTTPRLIIRAMHPQDAPSTHFAAAPASITKYMTLAFAYPYTLKHAEDWIAANLAPPFNHYFLCEKERADIVIGGIGLKPSSDVQSHVAEIGYWLGEPWQGKGIMREALEAFTEWCFVTRVHEPPAKEGGGKELTRLYAGVYSGNTGSMKCLEACGYRQEGVMKGHVEKHGVVYDMHCYGLVKSDWEEWRRKRGQS